MKEIIKKLDLIIDDRHQYSTIVHGIETYRIKGFDISISQYDEIHNKDLTSDKLFFLFFRYKGACCTELWSEIFLLNAEKEILIKAINNTMYNLKGFYYLN